MSVTQGIETRVSFSEKKYPLICLSSYSLQSALPEMFTSRNVNNLLFASQVMKSTSIIFSEDQKENILFKNVNGVLCCNRCPLQCLRTRM